MNGEAPREVRVNMRRHPMADPREPDGITDPRRPLRYAACAGLAASTIAGLLLARRRRRRTAENGD